MSKCAGLVPDGALLTPRQQARLERELALGEKVCKLCELSKSIENFYFDKRKLLHLTVCMDCINARERRRNAARICPLTRNIWREGRLHYHAGRRLAIWLAIERGATYRDLVQRFGICQQVLCGLVRKWGLPQPRRPRYLGVKVTSDAVLSRIHELVRLGWTYTEIARRLRCSRGAVASHVYNYMMRDLPWPLPEGQTYASWKALGLTGPRPASGGALMLPCQGSSAFSETGDGQTSTREETADAA